MDLELTVRQLLVFVHLFSFAFAIVEVIKHDFQILRRNKLDIISLKKSAKNLVGLMVLLWGSGSLLIYMSVGSDLDMLLSNPKLMAKITVVAILTFNGALLHLVAFPMLSGKVPFNAMLCALLGGVSTTTWIFASLIGASRILAPSLTYWDFIGIYSLGLWLASIVAIFYVRELLADKVWRSLPGELQLMAVDETEGLQPSAGYR